MRSTCRHASSNSASRLFSGRFSKAARIDALWIRLPQVHQPQRQREIAARADFVFGRFGDARGRAGDHGRADRTDPLAQAGVEAHAHLRRWPRRVGGGCVRDRAQQHAGVGGNRVARHVVFLRLWRLRGEIGDRARATGHGKAHGERGAVAVHAGRSRQGLGHEGFSSNRLWPQTVTQYASAALVAGQAWG